MDEFEFSPGDFKVLPKVPGLCRHCYFTRPDDQEDVCDHPSGRVVSCDRYRPRGSAA